MKTTLLALMFLLMAIPAKAQVQLSAGVGISNSVNLGELGPAPVFKSTLTVGDRFRFENDFEFSTMDKYTEAGWSASEGVDVLVFPSRSSGFFLTGGADYRHRNGGIWTKGGIKVGGGAGYGKGNSQFRFSVKDKVVFFNDFVKYSPSFEFLVRGNYPLRGSNWSLRTDTEFGFFKFTQHDVKATAFYTNTVLGFAYKWP